MTPDSLKSMLSMLREQGVRRFSDHIDGTPMTVEFFPPQGAVEESKALSPRQVLDAATEALEGEKCRCGHLLHGEHNELGCLVGCFSEQCRPAAPAGTDDATT